ncbi:unnamed protein product [Blepharisma stoltei]|uniref:cAMP-dependent protein kinase regulatory subunit n=1 Tax=Blepharisma stoltei TaxID=1481888 RepID=A0AAU9IJ99_9CILI|nr:unnamed protein product [Blepharisma stoltei]
MSGVHKDYIQNVLNPVLQDMVSALLISKPDDPIPFMVDWMKQRLNVQDRPSEKEELRILRQEVARLKANKNAGSEEEQSDESEGEFEEEDLQAKREKKSHRAAVSAEAYGDWNKKEDFRPRVIPKSQDQKERIAERLSKAFMFSALDEHEKEIVINAMEERIIGRGQTVIRQGDDGAELFVVDSGTLQCFKVINGQNKYLKDYNPGEAFGELAMLYNAPRAATITASSDCALWSLDRECFNHIVKGSAIRKRERYDQFLSKVKLLESMDPYERSQLSDAFANVVFNDGEYVIREGEEGNEFFIIEEGTAVATKTIHQGHPPEEVLRYSAGDYFGELALIKNEPRAANVIATSRLKCVSLDRHSFKRLLGPVEDILKRNARNYEEIIAKKK